MSETTHLKPSKKSASWQTFSGKCGKIEQIDKKISAQGKMNAGGHRNSGHRRSGLGSQLGNA